MPSTDTELLLRAKKGDPLAFESLIRPHSGAIRRFAHAFARHPSDADDLAQEALIKAFRSLHSFENRSSLTTWLYIVTRNVCHDHYRSRLALSRQRESGQLDDAESDGSTGPDALVSAKADSERLWDLIRQLPPEFRVPLVLFEIEGLGYEEISTIERIPVGTVRSRLSRARGHLKAALVRNRSRFSDNKARTCSATDSSHRGRRPPA